MIMINDQSTQYGTDIKTQKTFDLLLMDIENIEQKAQQTLLLNEID